jgi:hypothetical protein
MTNSDYQPYGIEWEKELMKLPKKFLINMIRDANLKRIALEETTTPINSTSANENKKV